MSTFWWMLIGAELLACVALWLPAPAFDRFQRTAPGRILDRAWTFIRWDLGRRG